MWTVKTARRERQFDNEVSARVYASMATELSGEPVQLVSPDGSVEVLVPSVE